MGFTLIMFTIFVIGLVILLIGLSTKFKILKNIGSGIAIFSVIVYVIVIIITTFTDM